MSPLKSDIQKIVRMNLDKHSHEKADDLSLLYDISSEINRSISIEDLARYILQVINKFIGCDVSFMLISDPGSSSLYFHLTRSIEDRQLKQMAKKARSSFQSLSGKKLSNIKTILFKPTSYIKEPSISATWKFFYSIPLFREGRPIGGIGFFSTDKLMERKLRLLYTISNLVSATLDRLSTLKEAEENRFKAVVNGMVEGVILTTLQNSVIMTNPAADRMVSKLHMKSNQEFIASLQQKELEKAVDEIKKGRYSSFSHEISFLKQQIVIQATVSAIHDSKGNINGIVYVLSDITKQRHMQQQMIQMEKLTALGELISGVAHELNNPLSSVIGYAQLLRHDNISKEVKEKLEIIHRESKRCQSIVQHLLLFARKHKIKKQEIDLHEALESVLQVLSYRLTIDKIQVKKMYAKVPLLIVGDFHLIQQVFLNILSNAQQAILENKRKGKIEIKTGMKDRKVFVEIRDNGPGISKENMERIFEPFFTTKEPGKGTGLGLSLAYETMREHQGHIRVKSQEGIGSSFTLEFPSLLKRDDQQKEFFQMRQDLMQGKRILVVEKDLEVLLLIEEALQESKPKITFASNSKMALDKLKESEFDLIISNARMGQLNGEDLIKEIYKEFPQLKGRLLLIVEGKQSRSAREFFKSKKAISLTKPLNLSKLQKTVSKVLLES